MRNPINIDDKAQLFQERVIESFSFLEDEFNMKKGRLRLLNQNDPREVTAKIRYESESHRIDIGWGIGENGIGILIWNKSSHENSSLPKNKNFVFFEPFLEFLTNGEEKPIIPQVYPKMSVAKIMKAMDEREQLFKTPLADIVTRLAKKLKVNYELVLSKDIRTFIEFHEWMVDHG